MPKNYDFNEDNLDWEVEQSDFNENLEDEEVEEEKYVPIEDIREDLEEEINLSELSETDITLDELEENTPNTNEIDLWLGSLNLYKNKKLKLKKKDSKTIGFDNLKKQNFLEKNFKNNDIKLREYNPKEDSFTDDFSDIENYNTVKNIDNENLSFDITKAKIWLFNYVKNSFKNKIKNINSQKKISIQNSKIKNILIIVISIIFVFIFGIFYKNILENNLKTGFEKLSSISNIHDYKEVRNTINEAKSDFAISSIMLFPLDLMFNNPIFQNKQYALVSDINSWAKRLTNSISRGFELFEWTQKLIEKKWIENIYYTQILHNSKSDVDYIASNLKSSFNAFNKVKNIIKTWKIKLPENLKNKFYTAYSQLEILSNFSSKIFDNYEVFLDILWDNKAKNYLVVFQNSDEIRPTGWFMWSMWIITIFKGKITNFERKDVYAYEWNLKPFTEKAPKWIDKISDTFGLRDANYYVNFKESSEKIKSHFDKLNKNIDWIIYLNLNSINKFLDEIWDVKIPNLSVRLNSENFSSAMSLLVESKLSKTWTLGTPKQVLFDFMDIFTKKLKEKWSYFEYIKIVWELIKNRELVFYSFDNKANSLAYELKINWNINYNALDYNYIVNTSISGNKSDRYIKRTYKKTVKQRPDCSVNTNLEIIHKHNFSINDELKFKNLFYKLDIPNNKTEELLQIQWKGQNYDYIRVILPKNAIVKWEYNTKKIGNHTQVDFYLKTPVWWKNSINFEYTLPNIECKNYDYKFYKQPWIKAYNFELKNWQEEVFLQNQITDFEYK